MQRRRLLINLLAAPLAGCWDSSSPNATIVSSNGGEAPPDGGGVGVGPTTAPIAQPARPPWPAAVGFKPSTPALIVPQVVPPYLKVVDDTRLLAPNVTADVTRTRLTRISDLGVFVPPVTPPTWNNFGPTYALQQHWSKDGDLLLLRATSVETDAKENPHAFYTAMHIVHGSTYQYLTPCVDANLRGMQSQWRWSNVVNDEIVCLQVLDSNYAEPKLHRFQPSSRTFSVLKDFSPTYLHQYAGFKYTGEDTQSRDGRYWALLLQKPGGQWFIVVWDRTKDVIAREWTVSADVTSHNISFGISPLGTYLWCASFGGEIVAGKALVGGISTFSVATGEIVGHLGVMNGATRPIGHTGANTDANGNEVWVWMHGEPGAALNERGLRSWRMDGSAPTTYTRQMADGLFLGFEYLNQSVPGQVVISDYPVPTNNALYNEFPLRGHVFVVRLDGSGTVRLVTSSRFSQKDHFGLNNNGYAFYPWATPNRDLSKILFKSCMNTDWSQGAPGEFHAYIAAGA